MPSCAKLEQCHCKILILVSGHLAPATEPMDQDLFLQAQDNEFYKNGQSNKNL